MDGMDGNGQNMNGQVVAPVTAGPVMAQPITVQKQPVTAQPLQAQPVMAPQTEWQIWNQGQQRLTLEEKMTILKKEKQIQLPVESIQNMAFADTYHDEVGARKRNSRKQNRWSRLKTKGDNAAKLEDVVSTKDQAQKLRITELFTKDPEMLQKVGRTTAGDLLQFCQGDDQQKMLEKYAGKQGQTGDPKEAVKDCMQSFMRLNLTDLHLRTDQDVAGSADRMEQIERQTEAITRLTDQHPESLKEMSPDAIKEFQAKLENATNISQYYRVRRQIITNAYYREHYNSEISYQYSENDTPQQRQLTMLLWRAETFRVQLQGARTTDSDWYSAVKMECRTTDLKEEVRKRKIVNDKMPEGEWGKNSSYIEDSPHAAYFRTLDATDTQEKRRLQKESYCVTGMNVAMHESFTRHMANLPRLKAIQQMPAADVTAMIEKLSKTPSNPADPKEVQDCQRANLEGMTLFKECLKRQMDYLKRKYGSGLEVCNIEEITAHHADLNNDFTNMQGMSEFVEYCKKLPGMFDQDDPEDAALSQAINYYQQVAFTESYGRVAFSQQSKSIAESKKDMAQALTLFTEHGVQKSIDTLDQQHADIHWNEAFAAPVSKIDSVLATYASAEQIGQRITELVMEGHKKIKWYDISPEFAGLTEEEATEKLWKMGGPSIEDQIQKSDLWRSEGITFGSVSVPGVGTDDFNIMNDIYKKIMAKPEIRADYGITTPEIFEQFKAYQKKTEEYGEKMHYLEDAQVKVMDLQDKIKAAVNGVDDKNTQALAGQMQDALNKVFNRYRDEYTKFRQTELDRFYNDFIAFRDKIGMFYYPEHRDVMKNVVMPEVLQTKPDAQITVAGQQYMTFSGSLTEEWKDKKDLKLKEGMDPNAFAAAIQEYNSLAAEFKTYNRIVEIGTDEAAQQTDETWKKIPHKKAFFEYDLYNKTTLVQEHMSNVMDKIRGMIA